MSTLRSCASALIVQRLTNAEGFTWAPTLSFRLISEIVGFSSGVFSSELLGLNPDIPFWLSEIPIVAPGLFQLCDHAPCSQVINIGSGGQVVEQSGGL